MLWLRRPGTDIPIRAAEVGCAGPGRRGRSRTRDRPPWTSVVEAFEGAGPESAPWREAPQGLSRQDSSPPSTGVALNFCGGQECNEEAACWCDALCAELQVNKQNDTATASVGCAFRYRLKRFPVGTQLHFFRAAALRSLSSNAKGSFATHCQFQVGGIVQRETVVAHQCHRRRHCFIRCLNGCDLWTPTADFISMSPCPPDDLASG